MSYSTEKWNVGDKVTAPNKRTDLWFSRVQEGFFKVAKRFAGKKIVYLEIGTWGGACCEFVSRNILTHPESLGIGIDCYPPTRMLDDMQGLKDLAASRVAHMGDRWIWIYEMSHHGLRTAEEKLHGRKVDLLYIDGCHTGSSTMQDFVGAWRLLHPGSIVIFDDYWHKRASKLLWPHVRDAVTAIQIAFAGMVCEVPGVDKRQIALKILHTAFPLMEDREKVIEALCGDEQRIIRKRLNQHQWFL